jgi:histidinol phosphatase-like PHP family hydrolase
MADGLPAPPDTNSRVAAALRDLAAAQASTQKAWGYKRAASAILHLEEPIEDLVQPDGTLRRIKHVGPASARVIREILETGRSTTVDAAVAAGGVSQEISTRARYREHFLSRAEVVRALRNTSLTGPALADCRGDFHMHSVWSDGADTVEAMVEACRARGYRYCAIADHSYGLPIARGVPMEAIAQQHAEIEALNARLGQSFRVLKGIEANLRADGTVDMTADELALFDLVIASPHSALRKSDDQTERMLRAVRQPRVHILGHPRGRMYGSRPGVSANWDQVFAAAAASGVAVEIDGDPSRQDLDHTLAARAVAAGCLLAVDSDAHGADQLEFADTAVAHARLAGIPPDRIVNTWPLERVLEWSARRKTT